MPSTSGKFAAVTSNAVAHGPCRSGPNLARTRPLRVCAAFSMRAAQSARIRPPSPRVRQGTRGEARATGGSTDSRPRSPRRSARGSCGSPDDSGFVATDHRVLAEAAARYPVDGLRRPGRRRTPRRRTTAPSPGSASSTPVDRRDAPVVGAAPPRASLVGSFVHAQAYRDDIGRWWDPGLVLAEIPRDPSSDGCEPGL